MSASAKFGANPSAPVPAPQRSEQRKQAPELTSDQAYIASLRRSIEQMKNGDAQPVREGLEELRRELDTDVQDDPVDT